MSRQTLVTLNPTFTASPGGSAESPAPLGQTIQLTATNLGGFGPLPGTVELVAGDGSATALERVGLWGLVTLVVRMPTAEPAGGSPFKIRVAAPGVQPGEAPVFLSAAAPSPGDPAPPDLVAALTDLVSQFKLLRIGTGDVKAGFPLVMKLITPPGIQVLRKRRPSARSARDRSCACPRRTRPWVRG